MSQPIKVDFGCFLAWGSSLLFVELAGSLDWCLGGGVAGFQPITRIFPNRVYFGFNFGPDMLISLSTQPLWVKKG